MSDSIAGLRHQIDSAKELESVVRTMKAMAASRISQYENAVRSLDDYYQTVQLGLVACFRENKLRDILPVSNQPKKSATAVIIFGSDQGLVGQFNEAMVTFVVEMLEKIPGQKMLWPVGGRIASRLLESKLQMMEGFPLPNSIQAITPLVGRMLMELDAQREQGFIEQVYLLHHRPQTGSISVPSSQQLLPLDEAWLQSLAGIHWPTVNLPEVLNGRDLTLRAMVREYLFVTLFRACAESLASENASRLAAMQRAEKNIDELQEDLNRTFHRLRQSGIDEELFDVISGFEALTSNNSKE